MRPDDWEALHEIDRTLSEQDPPLASWLAGLVRWRHPKRVVGAVYVLAPVLIVLGIVLPVAALVIVGVVLAGVTPVAAWFVLRPPRRSGPVADTLDDL